MGAWGTSLYANDTARDLRGNYLDGLRRGLTNEELTEKLIRESGIEQEEAEEQALFWFALADTQWSYGRLLPFVKDEALRALPIGRNDPRWQAAGYSKYAAWLRTLQELEDKLNSPQPPEKKVSAYRLYRCPWQLGDVFAYHLTGAASRGTEYENDYVVFRKISESTEWPGHRVPVVRVYKKIWNAPPRMELLSDVPYLEQAVQPAAMQNPRFKRSFDLKILMTSAKEIPAANLLYIGNLPGEDLVPFSENDPYFSTMSVGWDNSRWNRWFESYILQQYGWWKNIE